jgi:hypothetical protein
MFQLEDDRLLIKQYQLKNGIMNSNLGYPLSSRINKKQKTLS